jgi:hypothetical protein
MGATAKRNLLLLASFGLLAACAADRDAQDYRNDQALRDIARINEIAGTYSGRLMSADDEFLGMLSVELEAKTTASGDSGEITAALKTTLTIHTERGLTLTMDGGYYDWRSRTFKAFEEIPKGALTYKAEIFGNFEDDDKTLRGDLEIAEFPEYGTSFVLKKNRRLRPEESQDANSDQLAPGETWTYEGRFSDSMDVRMSIHSSAETRQQEFLEFLAPVKYVDLTLTFRGFAIPFEDAYWDLQNGTIVGLYQTAGVDRHEVRINCRSPIEDQSEQWTCRYFTSNTGTTRIFSVERVR